MSIDAGGLAQMTYNNSNNSNNTFPTNGGLGLPGSGFGGRTRLNSKKLSVALPPNVDPISEDQVDNPTPRTSRSHLLAGLRTQPKAPAAPGSAPLNQAQPSMQGLGASRWAQPGYGGYDQTIPQSGLGDGVDMSSQYSVNAARQMYSLSEQVLAPPSFYDQTDGMDPAVLQQMQMTSLYLAQRQQQLQQQLANITASAQGLQLDNNPSRSIYQQGMTPQTMYAQQQMQTPIEVPGQPGVYLVYNPAIQGYSYVVDQQAQQQVQQQTPSPVHHVQQQAYFNAPQPPSVSVSPPATERSTPASTRSFTPPKKAPSPPSVDDHTEPLPPPSANAFRRGHKKSPSSLSISGGVADGPKTSSTATFGSQRTVFPPTPMTGTFQPGAARAGQHPIRQPRGPPPLEELTAAPTIKHEGSKNFAARQRRRAVDNLMKAGIGRRGASRSSSYGESPVSESDFNFLPGGSEEDNVSVGSAGSAPTSRKMSPIGSEMKEKRSSNGSYSDGYCGLSSASSSEGEDGGAFKQPPTPANAFPPSVTPGVGGERRKMMLGVLNAAEKRKTSGGF